MATQETTTVVNFPNSNLDGFKPVLSKEGTKEMEQIFRKDRGGVNRRILLAVLTRNFDQLRESADADAETVLQMFKYGMQYLEQRDLFTKLVGRMPASNRCLTNWRRGTRHD